MNFDNKTPIYLQFMTDIKKKIFAGALAAGDKLPSVRDLALSEGINPNTAQKALSKLEEEGFLVTNRTNGRYVTEDKDFIERMKRNMAMLEVKRFLSYMKEMGYSHGEVISLINSLQKLSTTAQVSDVASERRDGHGNFN